MPAPIDDPTLLDRFVDVMKRKVDQFAAHYRASRVDDPDNWPLDFDDENWREQFLVWLDMDAEGSI